MTRHSQLKRHRGQVEDLGPVQRIIRKGYQIAWLELRRPSGMHRKMLGYPFIRARRYGGWQQRQRTHQLVRLANQLEGWLIAPDRDEGAPHVEGGIMT